MPKIHREFSQYTPEYYEAHRGKPSASNFHRIMQPTKGKMGAGATTYAYELVAESISQNPSFFTDRPETVHMRNGINSEPQARKWYEFTRSKDVETVGLVVTDDGRFCCSPDGLVGEEGGIELKCPKLETHTKYLVTGGAELLEDYRSQCHGFLIVTGRPWVDLMSYHPEAAAVLVRVSPDSFTERLRLCLDDFWDMYQEMLKKVRSA